ncbi:hypothetical protein F4604DRAFT_1677423 [Suillus subluteus]|nr:hypothetical protein F4604DRAFT_1677423 [Suillus subluteus]
MLESEVHGKEIDVDVPDTSSSSMITPLLFVQLSPVVSPIDNSHTLEDNGDADIIAAASKRKEEEKRKVGNRVTKLSSTILRTNRRWMSQLQAPKVTLKKKALPKITPATKSKSKPKGEKDEDSRGDSPKKDSEVIAAPETTERSCPTKADSIHHSQVTRRTPPPPLPRLLLPKTSKKQIEIEERIMEELLETVEGWSFVTNEERGGTFGERKLMLSWWPGRLILTLSDSSCPAGFTGFRYPSWASEAKTANG